jgi:hypothetical protein
MNRIRPEPKNEAVLALGDAPESEYTFLLVPVEVYSLVSQIARSQGCSVGEVFQKSLLAYVQAIESGGAKPPERQPSRPAPDLVVKRKRSP